VKARRIASASSASTEMGNTVAGQGTTATTSALFAAIFQQNWENVRHIKSERMWYMNAHAILSAGVLSLLQSIPGEFVLQLALLLSMCLLSLIAAVTSLRLKAELEECLEKLQTMIAGAQMGEFMAIGRLEGRRSRYPAFRWVFPVVYSLSFVLFVALFVHRLALGRHP